MWWGNANLSVQFFYQIIVNGGRKLHWDWLHALFEFQELGISGGAPSAIATGSAQALLIYHHLAWNPGHLPGKNIWNIDELHGNFVLDCTEKKTKDINS